MMTILTELILNSRLKENTIISESQHRERALREEFY